MKKKNAMNSLQGISISNLFICSPSISSNMKGIPEDMECNIHLWKMFYLFGEKGSVYAMQIITKWNMIES